MPIDITEVEPGSVAESVGIRPGDRLVSINGERISDELDFRFRVAEGILDLAVERPGGKAFSRTVVLDDGQQLGLSLSDFKAKACNNKCVFCFVDQLPKGVRRTLRFKDDDFRLSFLHGNYLTLTNLSNAEIDRIIEQRLSPLYVSVHATEMPVRAVMLGRPEAHCSLEPMLRLIDGGITVHAQVVLCPEINDGVHLERTITELSRYYPGLVSVAIVPLGTSRYRGNLSSLREVTPEYCSDVIAQVQPFQADFRRRLGATFAYLADEFYLQAGVPLPGKEYYDTFSLLEDGVGMVRYFDEEFRRVMESTRLKPRAPLNVTLVTSLLFHPFLCEFAGKLEARFGGTVRVVRAENEFMGSKITVAGLLSGGDIAAALQGRELGTRVVIPGEALTRETKVFLDDMTLVELEAALGVPVRQAGRTVEGFFEALDMEPHITAGKRRRKKEYPARTGMGS